MTTPADEMGPLVLKSGRPVVRDPEPDVEWTVDDDGFLHSWHDQPAWAEFTSDGTNGTREWYRHGVHHRDGGRPAVTRGDGVADRYFVDGVPHRVTGPAVERTPGLTDRWALHGQWATPDQQERLTIAYRAGTHTSGASGSDLTDPERADAAALTLVGTDPWVAAVILANPRIRVSDATRFLLTLTAANMPRT